MSERRFWMLYRAGGHAPAFKHESIDGARSEGRRVAHVSGSKVFVLEAVEIIEFSISSTSIPSVPIPEAASKTEAAIDPPSVREVTLHAESYPYRLSGEPNATWGLWLVVTPDGHGKTIPVKCWGPLDLPRVPAAYYGGLRCSDFPAGTRWYPLRADGSPIPQDDIPF